MSSDYNGTSVPSNTDTAGLFPSSPPARACEPLKASAQEPQGGLDCSGTVVLSALPVSPLSWTSTLQLLILPQAQLPQMLWKLLHLAAVHSLLPGPACSLHFAISSGGPDPTALLPAALGHQSACSPLWTGSFLEQGRWSGHIPSTHRTFVDGMCPLLDMLLGAGMGFSLHFHFFSVPHI